MTTIKKAINLIKEYQKINNDDVVDLDLKGDMYDWNMYDIEGYIEYVYDLTSEEINHLENRVKALRNYVKAMENLKKFETKYS